MCSCAQFSLEVGSETDLEQRSPGLTSPSSKATDPNYGLLDPTVDMKYKMM